MKALFKPVLFSALCILGGLTACGGSSNYVPAGSHTDNSAVGTVPVASGGGASTEGSVTTGRTNPALSFCTGNGHHLAPVKEHGITRYYLCVNPATNRKCKANAYHRGECSL